MLKRLWGHPISSLWIIGFMVAIPTMLSAAPTLILKPGATQYPLGLYFDILEDTEQQWSIDDVVKPELSQLFTPSTLETPNAGMTKAAIWVRFRVQHDFLRYQEWLLEVNFPLVDHVEFYQPSDRTSGFIKHELGNGIKLKEKVVSYPTYIFNFQMRPQEELTFYMRYYDESPISFPAFIWEPKAFMGHAAQKQYFFGLYYGCMFVMIFYNFALFLFRRDSVNLYFLCYLLGFALFMLYEDGWAQMYIFPEASSWWMNRSQAAAGVLTGLAGMLFVKAFLNTCETLPRWNKCVNILIAIGLIQMVMHFLVSGFWAYSTSLIILGFLGFITVFLTYGAVFLSMQKKYQPAKLLMIGFLIFFPAFILRFLTMLGTFELNTFTSAAIQCAFIIEVIIIMIAMMQRDSLQKDEKIAELHAQLVSVP